MLMMLEMLMLLKMLMMILMLMIMLLKRLMIKINICKTVSMTTKMIMMIYI